MRKILLTVMMVSTLLAFNACTKDGAQGPAGPAGTAGAPGAAGAKGDVGPEGKKGDDGATIRAAEGAPAASLGNDGDFYFDKTAKVLYGPKAAGAWPATGTSLTGPAGKAGSSFTAGAGAGEGGKGAPAADYGNVGDYYFNTVTSTFYGPKAEDGSWAAGNQLPLGVGGGAKTYFYNVKLSDVKLVAGSKEFGEDVVETYPSYGITTTYKVTAEDMIRIDKYPGWGDNREMAFETVPGNGVFTNFPANGAALQALPLGTRFIFTQDPNNDVNIFNLSAADKVKFGSTDPDAFDYMINAKADPATVALGKTLNFANVKNVSVKTSTTDFTAEYTAKASFDLDDIVKNYEKNIQQGGVVIARTQLYNQTTGKLSGTWVDLTPYRNTYTVGDVEWGPGLKTTAVAGITNTDVFGLGATFNLGDVTKVGTQSVTLANLISKQGKFTYEYEIVTGDAVAGPLDLTPANGSNYYSNAVGTHLTATPAGILVGNDLTIDQIKNGQAEAYFSGKNLMLINVLVLDAATVEAAKKAGINIEDANALEQFVSKR